MMYLILADMLYSDGSKVKTKIAAAYVSPDGGDGYRLRGGCSSLLQQ